MKLLRYALLGIAITSVTACDDDAKDGQPDVDEPEVANAEVRLLHASPDAPSVSVLVDGESFYDEVVFKEGTAFEDFDEGTYSLQIDATLPDGSTVTGIGPVDVTFDADTEYTFVATGKVIDDSLDVISVIHPVTEVADGMVNFIGVHAAPDAPAVDVYATTADEPLDSVDPIVSFAYGEQTETIEGAAGGYRFRVTPAGDKSTVVFDTGATPLDIESGASLLIAAVDNAGTGSSPIQLVIMDGEGSETVLDTNTPAEVKLAHSAPGVGAVDVYADAGEGPAPLVEDLLYGAAAPLCDALAGDYEVAVSPADMGVEAALITGDVELEAGKTYSAIATVIDGEPSLIVTEDEDRAIATQVSLKVVNGAPDEGSADVWVLPAGEATLDDVMGGTIDPTMADISVGDTTDAMAFTPGDYDVFVVTEAGDTLELLGGTYDPGLAVTAVLRGPETLAPEPAGLGLVVLSNALCDSPVEIIE